MRSANSKKDRAYASVDGARRATLARASRESSGRLDFDDISRVTAQPFNFIHVY